MELLFSLIGIPIGAAVAIGIAVYQRRTPVLQAKCYVPNNGDPTVLECTIRNSGRKEARDVYVGFNRMLPVGTRVFAQSELRAEIRESEVLLDPRLEAHQAEIMQTFAVYLPRVAPKDSVTFQVATVDEDNRRAGLQVVRIREILTKILNEFGERLVAEHKKEAAKWSLGTVLSGRIKRESFFYPGNLSYENGRQPIEFLSEEELMAEAVNQDLYSQYKAEFIDVFQGHPEFKAPVIRVKTSEGQKTIAIFPPYVRTYIAAVVSREQMRKGIRIDPPVPDSYD